MTDALQITLLILSIAAAVVGLIRVLILSPLDKRLKDNQRETVAAIGDRLDEMDATASVRRMAGLLWARALHADLTRQNIEAPHPDTYKWEPDK